MPDIKNIFYVLILSCLFTGDLFPVVCNTIKSLYNFDLPEIYGEKLDEISNSIRDKNFTLINKILEMDFNNEGLGTIQTEADIDYLYKYTRSHSSESEVNIAIEFIVE